MAICQTQMFSILVVLRQLTRCRPDYPEVIDVLVGDHGTQSRRVREVVLLQSYVLERVERGAREGRSMIVSATVLDVFRLLADPYDQL